MESVSRVDVERLCRPQGRWCVSVYMPVAHTGSETREGPLLLKNLLRDAEIRLFDRGLAGNRVAATLQPARELLRDHEFWKQRGGGLALFLDDTGLRLFHLPVAFVPSTMVGERFHIAPLLPLVGGHERFFVLALSQNRVRLLDATRFEARAVEVEGMPTSMAEALKDDDPDPQYQFHTSGRAPGVGGSAEASVHGHGVGVNDPKDDLERFLRRVSSCVARRLHAERAPLVLAGVEYVVSIYSSVDSYAHSVREIISGNVDSMSDDDLRRASWRTAERVLGKARDEAMAGCRELLGRRSSRATDGLDAILRAARDGRVQTLFLAAGDHRWGTVDDDAMTTRVHATEQPGDDDLLDLAAARTLANQGVVYSVEAQEVPGGSAVAAVLRY